MPKDKKPDAKIPAGLAAKVGEQLAGTLGGLDMTPEAIVALVLEGVNAVQAGDPLGMIRRDPAGKVYVRVSDGGVHKWRVVDPNDGGANTFDMSEIEHPVIGD